MIWQILIATIKDRTNEFIILKREFEKQILDLGLEDEVGILFDCDNREKPIGKKRQDLLERSKADYINFFDDDDFPYPYYVERIYQALLSKPDCIGLIILMTTNGINLQTCCHSLRNKIWAEKVNGYDYVRNVTHFNPVKREFALKTGFNVKSRFGEDKDYSYRLTRLCRNEVFINKPIFHYIYSNKIPYKEKYGFE